MAPTLSRLLPPAACAALLAVASAGFAGPTDDTTPVPSANPRVAGTNQANYLTQQLIGRPVLQAVVAEGAMPVENPLLTVGGVKVTNYGYYDNGPQVPLLTGATPYLEATKSEPDKNTYLVLCGQHGPDQSYDYGSHFLFQGHENGPRDTNPILGTTLGARGYVTRVNLDADKAHRVTLLATQDKAGNNLPAFDGSTWNPFAHLLLLTAETLVLGSDGSALSGGMWTVTPDWPSTATDISGIVGRGGYEGVQCDSDGNLWIVEDIGGKNGTQTATHAKQPNSFVYRFVPKNPYDLSLGGRLQVLQVASKAHAGAILFLPGTTDADILTQDMKDLHTYGNSFATKWVTIHDTAVDGTTPFNANALAKAKGGTPFKRPENGVFRPGTGFRDFVFTETGDTNSLTEATATYGGFGGLFTLSQKKPSDDTGTLKLLYRGDVVHTGLDNVTFLTANLVLSGEDAGDTLHGQRNALDSLWMFDADQDYSGGPAPVRVLAEGRDAAATLDTILPPLAAGFINDGDNEITGVHVSDGDSTVGGLFGKEKPRPFRDGWRVFWTQQHGTNTTWEIVTPRDHDRGSECGCDRDSRHDDDKHDDGHDDRD